MKHNQCISNTLFFSLALSMMFIVNFAHGQIINTIAGNGSYGSSGDGGPATAAEISNPMAVVVDGIGNVYFSDVGSNKLRKVNTSGVISTIAGTGTAGFSGDGGAATLAQINPTWGVTCDASGNIYFSDEYENKIRKINTAGIVTTIAGTDSVGFYGDGGPATAAWLNGPSGLAVDGSGNIYIVDCFNQRVRKISTSGIITTIAGNGTAAFSGDGGPATAAEMYQPKNVVLDGAGNIYISDWDNFRIRKVNTSGIINTIAGNGGLGYSGDGGAATNAQIGRIGGIAINAIGDVFISAGDFNSVRKISSGVISRVSGNSAASGAGFSGDGGPATAALLNYPYGLACDGSNNLYLADYNNQRIRKISSCYPVLGIISGVTPVCAGGTLTLSDTTIGGTWSSGTSSIATVSAAGIVTALMPGNASIYYSKTNGCGTSTISAYVTVESFPNSGAILGVDSLCPGHTTALTDAATGGTWVGTNPAVATVNSTGTLTSVTPGTTNILYIVTNSCGSDTAVFPFVVRSMASCPNGVNNINNQHGFSIYPNPNHGNFTVNISAPIIEKIPVTVTNLLGKKVKEFTVTANTASEVRLEVPVGVYFVSAATQSGVLVQKVIITE